MEEYRAELAKKKEEKQLEQEQARAEKGRKNWQGRGSQTPGGGGSQTSDSSQSQSQLDSNAAFTIEDYELICSYLGVPDNYSKLYGSGNQTDFGPRPLTKTVAYEMKKVAEITGAGIEEEHGILTLRDLLNEKCPCYKCMDAIFGAKPNVTPCMQYNSVDGSNLYGSSDGSSPEVVHLGWEEFCLGLFVGFHLLVVCGLPLVSYLRASTC
ncbi:uncharacterized protein PGTG_14961 [Puccinia graminis f. sp. tritici CRL 75-36-700-3]|uniref:Uncharacterized protein n=1 Tax=Puccinia graminis f. sp. tritici (strain CRL 75-36-700-3 / race SCCL) TaxID=418459 RepID=E3KXQ8_PUCGT|nr:uncharacterized protein PGTG_14961 [Puccinia graminis f. sp. tritici CRL 75-36-700-3]EFP89120.2 hypothetical protein PGTG_14961 [Puccinia graminis f. sp. tritici CRL 75-36-700-3]